MRTLHRMIIMLTAVHSRRARHFVMINQANLKSKKKDDKMRST